MSPDRFPPAIFVRSDGRAPKSTTPDEPPSHQAQRCRGRADFMKRFSKQFRVDAVFTKLYLEIGTSPEGDTVPGP